MASVSSKTDQIVDEKLVKKKEVDDIKLDGEENTMTYGANSESEDVCIIEGFEKSGKIRDSERLEKIDVDLNLLSSIEVNVKDLEDGTGIPEEQKKEISDAVVPDVSEATVNDDLNDPISNEVSVNDLQVQSAFPEEQKQENTRETQEPSSVGAIIDIGGDVVQSSSHEEKASGDAEAKSDVAQNSTDLTAAEVSSDQGRAPEAVEIVEEDKDMRFNIKKEAIEATVKELNIVPGANEVPSEDKEVSASDERESQSSKDVDATSVEAPKDFTTIEESPEQVIKENKNESSKNDREAPAETSNDLETPEFTAEVVKDIGSSEMVEENKNDSQLHSVVEKNVQISDDKKEETQLEEAIQIATDKSENKELGAEKEETEKSKTVDPIVPSDTADTKLIKESTKPESNNFFSKVKRTIVKAKKAILGKSPRPKTLSTEIKDDKS